MLQKQDPTFRAAVHGFWKVYAGSTTTDVYVQLHREQQSECLLSNHHYILGFRV